MHGSANRTARVRWAERRKKKTFGGFLFVRLPPFYSILLPFVSSWFNITSLLTLFHEPFSSVRFFFPFSSEVLSLSSIVLVSLSRSWEEQYRLPPPFAPRPDYPIPHVQSRVHSGFVKEQYKISSYAYLIRRMGASLEVTPNECREGNGSFPTRDPTFLRT